MLRALKYAQNRCLTNLVSQEPKRESLHTPVMLSEVLDYLVKDKEVANFKVIS
jgi:hypothetical protein